MITLRRTRHDREILRLAVPALGALAADPLVSLVDTAFVGRLGADALGSLAIAVAVFTLAFAVFNFLAYGTTPMIARAIGGGDLAAAGRIALTATVIGAALGILTAVIVATFATPFLEVLGAGPDTLAGAEQYLRIRALALPAMMLVTVGHGVFRGYQDTRTPMIVTFGLNAVNLVLDPIFIFGLDAGLAGAAWATVVAQWLGAVWFLSLLAVRREAMAISWARPRRTELRAFLGASQALVLRTFALLGTLTVATAVAARIGTVEVASHQVASQVWLFLALVVDALAIAGQAMIGKALAIDRTHAREIAARLLGMGLVGGLLLGAVVAAGVGVLPTWFTDDTAVIDQVRGIYWFIVVMQPLNAAVFVYDGIGIGAGSFGYLAGSMVLAGALSTAALLAVWALSLGLAAVWWAMVLLMVARLATLVWWHRTGPLAA
ncbi:MAG: MATE family efflux transporter [Acidimicrobiia bacterium]|nr:MATE family efflux transporter [Acidimicrobiia bacterium]